MNMLNVLTAMGVGEGVGLGVGVIHVSDPDPYLVPNIFNGVYV